MNVPGIAGLGAALELLKNRGLSSVEKSKQGMTEYCVKRLSDVGVKVLAGEHHCGTVSFVPPLDCEIVSEKLAARAIAVRSGLHCAPLAHESAGTLDTGTVRVSFGYNNDRRQIEIFMHELQRVLKKF